MASPTNGYTDYYIGDDNTFYLYSVPTAPYKRLQGWYTDPDLTQLYSTADPFYYRPQQRHIELYPKFAK